MKPAITQVPRIMLDDSSSPMCIASAFAEINASQKFLRSTRRQRPQLMVKTEGMSPRAAERCKQLLARLTSGLPQETDTDREAVVVLSQAVVMGFKEGYAVAADDMREEMIRVNSAATMVAWKAP